MTIQNIIVGTWLPRTSIHLNEIYLFLKNGSSSHLEKKELLAHKKKLHAEDVLYTYRPDFDELTFTSEDVRVTITEDGVILVQLDTLHDTKKDVKKIEQFCLEKLEPALAHLFSRGAPLTHALLKSQNAFPKILVGKHMKEQEVSEYLEKESLLSVVSFEDLKLYYGEETEFIDVEKTTLTKKHEDELKNILIYTVFIRTFSILLEHYLQLHRKTWTEIAHIRENTNIRYRDFTHVRNEILEITKTISFVRARLKQMNDILSLRNTLAPESFKQRLFAHGLNNFVTLEKSYQYIDSLWQMTADYGNSTMTLYESLLSENAEREIRLLQMITITGTLVGFFGMNISFPWNDSWHKLFPSSFAVLFFMIAILIIAYFLIKLYILNRRFPVVNKKDSHESLI